MLEQPPVWLILIAFLAALGPLVFIHELGHYLVGRWCGVGAETFSIGFGREVAGWTDKRGTRWKVGWLPLGGYVRFTGDMDPASMGRNLDQLDPELRARSFHAKPIWQRFLIVLAGPMANFLLAIAIFAGFLAIYGTPSTPPVVGKVIAGSAAERSGLQPGDRIVSLANRDVETFTDLQRITVLRPNETVPMEVQRGATSRRIEVTLTERIDKDRFGQVYRSGQLGVMPLPGRHFDSVSPLRLIPEATKLTIEITRSTMTGLWQIITGRRPVEEIGGPLKMAQIAGQQATLGIDQFIQIIALFSINLGFINLLPVPMLDGGHLVLYTVEAVRRRPLGERAQEWMFRGGFAALLTLILFTTVNDLGSFGLWERLARLVG